MKLAVSIALLTVWSVQAQTLPAGKGKAVLEEVCSECHGADAVVVLHQSKQAWSDLVFDMVSKGASATGDQLDTIIDYLATNFPNQVNVNNGAAKEISDTLGVTPAEADLIVKYRKDHGPFKDFDDLAKVDGVDQSRLTAKRKQIAF